MECRHFLCVSFEPLQTEFLEMLWKFAILFWLVSIAFPKTVCSMIILLFDAEIFPFCSSLSLFVSYLLCCGTCIHTKQINFYQYIFPSFCSIAHAHFNAISAIKLNWLVLMFKNEHNRHTVECIHSTTNIFNYGSFLFDCTKSLFKGWGRKLL